MAKAITSASFHLLEGPTSPKKGGRPRVPDPFVAAVSTRVTATDYDRLASAARRETVSVAAFVRALVRRAVRADPSRT